ncbi:MAG: helix-turn-helix domain-containing protein [Gammaproteobacteria bacterium]|nr:helix-turn-helix domain-containing protein [Gammaproteobacteria bacterium]
MEPKIIKSRKEYRVFLDEVMRLIARDPPRGSPEGDRLELLAKLVEDYERERFRFEKPDPIDALRFRMEERGLKQKDLAGILGGKNRVSEVLNRRRPLTLRMARALSESLDIPAELLIREPRGEYSVHARRGTRRDSRRKAKN